MTEAPPLEKVLEFQKDLISKNGPVYYAVVEKRVVGWCDIMLRDNPRFAHRGSLALGLLPDYRGKGLGTKLINAALEHAKKIGLEKIDLEVYTINTHAIALYKKVGFIEEGLKRRNRKLDGEYFDIILMAKFLK